MLKTELWEDRKLMLNTRKEGKSYGDRRHAKENRKTRMVSAVKGRESLKKEGTVMFNGMPPASDCVCSNPASVTYALHVISKVLFSLSVSSSLKL